MFRFLFGETAKTLVVAVLLAMLFRSFVFEPFHIPSGSMKSTLLIGDYLFVTKFAYGYSRYSFPFAPPLFDGRMLAFALPKRGDIVVFRPPNDTSVDYIKRVMGLPGDHVQVKDGTVYINGEALQRQRIDNFLDKEYGEEMQLRTHEVPRFNETLPSNKTITILKEYHDNTNHIDPYDDSYTADNTPVFDVPPHMYFMMGDNRDNSHDSRFSDLRYVPEQNLVGRADLIFFSTDGSAQWRNPFSWFTAMRLNRFFTFIR